jgi:hypothetical protein
VLAAAIFFREGRQTRPVSITRRGGWAGTQIMHSITGGENMLFTRSPLESGRTSSSTRAMNAPRLALEEVLR